MKGIKENTLGRKKTNYPKRSQIIKVDKETGKLIYPEKHPLHKDNNRRPASEAVEMASRSDHSLIFFCLLFSELYKVQKVQFKFSSGLNPPLNFFELSSKTNQRELSATY